MYGTVLYCSDMRDINVSFENMSFTLFWKIVIQKVPSLDLVKL